MLANVRWVPDAEAECDAIADERERVAIQHAVDKLEAMGLALDFPHQSAVKGSPGLRELRPRRGRSRLRAFYRLVGDTFVVASVGSEADVDAKGFRQAVRLAEQRLILLQEI